MILLWKKGLGHRLNTQRYLGLQLEIFTHTQILQKFELGLGLDNKFNWFGFFLLTPEVLRFSARLWQWSWRLAVCTGWPGDWPGWPRDLEEAGGWSGRGYPASKRCQSHPWNRLRVLTVVCPQALLSHLGLYICAVLLVTLLVLWGQANYPGPAVLRPLQPVLWAYHSATGGRHCIEHLTSWEAIKK